MKDQKKGIDSHSWLIWGLAAACFAVSWALLTGWPETEPATLSADPVETQLTIEQELPADEPLDKLEPVQQWFEENIAQDRQAVQPYREYVRVSDDTDTISLQLPREWNDIDIMEWKQNGQPLGHYIAASGNLAGFESGEEAGISMRVYVPEEIVPFRNDLFEKTSLDDILADEQSQLATTCRSQGSYDLKNNFYDVEYEFLTTCGRAKQQILTVQATPRHQSYVILLKIVITNQADVDAAARILQSFQVLGEPVHSHHDHD